MVNPYLSDIGFALLLFPLVAGLLVLPYAIIQYRRLGAVNLWKTFVAFSFIFYLMCAVFLVLMPLPADHTILVPGALTPQLVPFHALQLILANSGFVLTDPTTWLPALRYDATYTTLFNILLTMPLGFFFRYLFHLRWWQALCLGFLTSLAFEVTQFTGIYGVYEHPYRYADVDDLITNTFGTMLGYWLTIPVAHVLPDLRVVDARSEFKGATRVSLTRRFVAILIDGLIVVVATGLILVATGGFDPDIRTDTGIVVEDAFDMLTLGGEGDESDALGEAEVTAETAWTWVKAALRLTLEDPLQLLGLVTGVGALVFILIPIITGGRTPGQAAVGIVIVTGTGGRPRWYRYFVRYGIPWLIFCIPLIALALFPGYVAGIHLSTLAKFFAVIYGLWLVTLIVRLILAATGRRFLVLTDLISQTTLAPRPQRV